MFKNKGNTKFSDGVQATLNQLYKRWDKEKVDGQVVEVFYTNVFLLNVIRIWLLQKYEMIGRYGVGYKDPSYHVVRERLLECTMQKIDLILEE